ncbi:poly(ADP-ribose) glycohydrolase-like isoform X2 [Rhinoraja longicauda]
MSSEGRRGLGGDRDVGWTCHEDRRESVCLLVTDPVLKPTRDHSILVEVAGVPYGIILPFTIPDPEKVWDSAHVKMPFSTFNKHALAIPGQHCGGGEVNRWDVIRETLNRSDFRTAKDLESAIKLYNPKYSNVWRFVGLCQHLDQMLPAEQRDVLRRLLPQVAQLALQAPHLCQKPVPLLKVGMKLALTLSQEQAACLLANAFFCTFPHRNATRPHTEYSNFPTINFSSLFESTSPRTCEKLKAIFCYFRSVVGNMPRGLITFQRCCLSRSIDWQRSQCKVTQLHLSSGGTIEDNGRDMLQVDFAAAMVGGGVLGRGLVQEEIRFLINPELIVARLFTERLDDTECLLVTGAQRYSDYTGFSDTFRWTRAHLDAKPRDSWQRRRTQIVAMDAVKFDNPLDQYNPHYLKRELTKAFCGFSCRVLPDQHRTAVATGNWGCGAFKGDVKLKALIQIMAAAQAHRDLMYFTFGNSDSMKAIHTMHQFLEKRNITGKFIAFWRNTQEWASQEAHGKTFTSSLRPT